MEDWLAALRRQQPGIAWDLFIARHTSLVFAAIRHYARDHDDVMDAFAFVCGALREDDLRRLRRYREAHDGGARFTTWLVTVVRNLTIDWFRTRSGRRPSTTTDPGLSPLGQRIVEYVYLGRCSHAEAYELICSRDPPGPSFREFLAELRATHQALTKGRLRGVLRDLAPPAPNELSQWVPNPAESSDLKEQLESLLRTLSPEDRLMLELYVVDELPAAEVARIVGLPGAKAVYNGVYRTLALLRERLFRSGIREGDL